MWMVFFPSKTPSRINKEEIIMLIDEKFKNWVESLSQNYKKAQIKAAVHVNSELIEFYYKLGEEISKTSFKASYGSNFYNLLSIELKKAIPNCKGLNHQNIRYAEKFYTLYKENFPQVVGELVLVPWGHHRIIIDKCKTIETISLLLLKVIYQETIWKVGF